MRDLQTIISINKTSPDQLKEAAKPKTIHELGKTKKAAKKS